MSTRKVECVLVAKLGRHQHAKLRRNSDRDWKGHDPRKLLDLAAKELWELRCAIQDGLSLGEVWDEAADVANYVAMAADCYFADEKASR